MGLYFSREKYFERLLEVQQIDEGSSLILLLEKAFNQAYYSFTTL